MFHDKSMKTLLMCIRFIGVFSAIWLFVQIGQSFTISLKVLKNNNSSLDQYFLLLLQLAAPLITALLLILPWRKIRKRILWSVFYSLFIISGVIYMLSLFFAAPKDNLPFLILVFAILLSQAIVIVIIDKTTNKHNKALAVDS